MKTLLRLLSIFAISSLSLTAADREELFSQAELDQMLAPIALYPDSLLVQILTASTYPLEVVEAARWSSDHRDLEGTAAVEAVDERPWDPSVKALVAFPRVLDRMDEDLTWTKRLGDAVLLQEEQVMSSVQHLREKAYAAGSLRSLDNVSVRRDKEVIYIEPADPRIIYVPYYRPTVVYGSWWWPSHPPVYWDLPTTVSYRHGGTHIVWTSGVFFHSRFFITRPDWHRRHIVIHHHHHDHSSRGRHDGGARERERDTGGERWRHDPRHRRGVTYRSERLDEHFGRSPASSVRDNAPKENRGTIRYAPHPGRRVATPGSFSDRVKEKPTSARPSSDRRESIAERLMRRQSERLERSARDQAMSPARSRPEPKPSHAIDAERIRQRLARERANSEAVRSHSRRVREPYAPAAADRMQRRLSEMRKEHSAVREKSRRSIRVPSPEKPRPLAPREQGVNPRVETTEPTPRQGGMEHPKMRRPSARKPSVESGRLAR